MHSSMRPACTRPHLWAPHVPVCICPPPKGTGPMKRGYYGTQAQAGIQDMAGHGRAWATHHGRTPHQMVLFSPDPPPGGQKARGRHSAACSLDLRMRLAARGIRAPRRVRAVRRTRTYTSNLAISVTSSFSYTLVIQTLHTNTHTHTLQLT